MSVSVECFFCGIYRWWCVVIYCFGGVYCYEVGDYALFCNGGWVCADICCVSSVIECGLCIVSLCSGCDGCCARFAGNKIVCLNYSLYA